MLEGRASPARRQVLPQAVGTSMPRASRLQTGGGGVGGGGGGGTRPGLRLLAPSDLPSSPTPGLGTLGRISAVGAAGGPAAALASAPPGESRWPGHPRCGEGVLPAVGARDAPGPWPGWRSSLECCRVSGCGSCPRASGKEEWKPVNWKPCFNLSLEVFSDYESNLCLFSKLFC